MNRLRPDLFPQSPAPVQAGSIPSVLGRPTDVSGCSVLREAGTNETVQHPAGTEGPQVPVASALPLVTREIYKLIRRARPEGARHALYLARLVDLKGRRHEGHFALGPGCGELHLGLHWEGHISALLAEVREAA